MDEQQHRSYIEPTRKKKALLKEARHSTSPRIYDELRRCDREAYAKKKNELLKILKRNQSSMSILLDLSQMYICLSRYRSATKCAKMAIEIDPNQEEAYILLGKAMVYSGDWRKGYQLARKAMEISPNDYKQYLRFAEMFYKKKQRAAKFKYLKKAYALAPDNAFVNYQLGRWYDEPLLKSVKTIREALKCFRKTVTIRTEDDYLWLGIGGCCRDLDLNDEALNALNEVIRLRPDSDYAYSLISAIFKRQGKYNEAEKTLKKAIKLDPKEGLYRYDLGEIYLINLNDCRAAIREYRKLKRIDEYFASELKEIIEMKTKSLGWSVIDEYRRKKAHR